MAVKSSQIPTQPLVLTAFLFGAIYLINEAAGGFSWFVTLSFDMDRENTIQSWFSSFLWILCALTAWGAAENQRIVFEKRVWQGIAAVFLFFSADESAMIHERLSITLNRIFQIQDSDRVIWPIILSPLLLILFGGLIWFGSRTFNIKNPAHWKMAAGLGIFIFAAVATEAFVHRDFYRSFGAGIVFAEEMGEMLGAILIYSGLKTEKNAPEELPAIFFNKETLQEVPR